MTYWMNRLQNIDERWPLFVSMNPLTEPDLNRLANLGPPLSLDAAAAASHPAHVSAPLPASEPRA